MKLFLFALLSVYSFGATATEKHPNGDLISRLTGLAGMMNEKEGVYKVSFPRGDIKATAGGVDLTPPMGLTAWAAFKMIGNKVMMMGDTVLTEDQVNPVLSVALNEGLEVTALHNHFFGDSPKVMFMHIGGMGSEEEIATAVGHVYAKVKETMNAKVPFPTANIDTSKSSINPDPLNSIF